ncbi:MAG: TrkH family potassium uptake protein [Phycisphaerales bacterium]
MSKTPDRRLRRQIASPLRWQGLRSAVAIGSVIPTLLAEGWREPLVGHGLLMATQILLLLTYTALLYMDQRLLKQTAPHQQAEYLAITRPEWITASVGLLLIWWWPALVTVMLILALTAIVRGYLRLVQTRIPSGLVFIGSFAVFSMIGTVLLKLPRATPPGQEISWLDSAFTIVSAISQTGLVVRPTGEGFERFGQIVILIWIQVGALGVIVFGALLASLFGSGFGLKATQSMAEGTEQGWSGQIMIQRLVTFIIIFTHAVQAVGAAILFFAWPEEWMGMPADMVSVGDRVYHSIYFSVSAFTNAGFVTTDNSLIGLRGHWIPHLVIAPLIILGSIGFPVLRNVWDVLVAKFRHRRLNPNGGLIRINLNTKIIVGATLIAYLIGYVLIVISEYAQTSEPLHLILLDAHFMSVNRTAGFNTIETGEMGRLALLALIFTMFLGGSPVSVAGGIKMMVFAILAFTVWSNIRGQSVTTAFGRTIPDALVRKSATIVVLFLLLLLISTGVLAVSEPDLSLTQVLFEATSACSTVGLSTGITDELSPVGRATILVSMFIGRVGVFALLAALISVRARSRPRIEYATEDVPIY